MQPLSLDNVTPVGDCTRSSRKHTYLDVLLYPLPNLLRQLATLDWRPPCVVVPSVDLSSVSVDKIPIVRRALALDVYGP